MVNYFFTHSISKAIGLDQKSGFKNKLVDQYCKSKGINLIFCSVGDHRGCGLVEQSSQTIKRKLGTSQFEENPPDIHTALKMNIEDIRITKKSVTVLSPFELHFGRKPNSEWSLATDIFTPKIVLDEQNLERDLLTPEERIELCESKLRVKVVKKGLHSRDTSPKFKLESAQIANTPYYKSLEQLAKSANEWMTWKRKLFHEEGCRALRTLTERNQLLAACLRNILTTGTLRFRQGASDSPITSTKCHQGPSKPLLGKKLKRH